MSVYWINNFPWKRPATAASAAAAAAAATTTIVYIVCEIDAMGIYSVFILSNRWIQVDKYSNEYELNTLIFIHVDDDDDDDEISGGICFQDGFIVWRNWIKFENTPGEYILDTMTNFKNAFIHNQYALEWLIQLLRQRSHVFMRANKITTLFRHKQQQQQQ